MRQVFSFEPLLIGGNPLSVPAIYAMIHFVEKTWGVHYRDGRHRRAGDGAVVKFEELGGTMRYDAKVARIDVEKRGRQARRDAASRSRSGETLAADLVVSNGDYATTYLKLIDKAHRRINRDARGQVPQAEHVADGHLLRLCEARAAIPICGTTTSSSGRATRNC